MPAKKISKNGTRNRKANNKKILASIGLIVAATIAVCAVTLVGGKLLDGFERQRMARHLRDKYGEEFTVGPVRVVGAGIGEKGWNEAAAHPNTATDLIFNVKSTDKRVEDSYIDILVTRNEGAATRDMVTNAFPDNIRPEYSSMIHLSNAVEWPVHKGLTLDDALERNAEHVLYDLNLSIERPISGPEQDAASSSLQELIKQIYRRGVKKVGINYSYIDDSDKKHRCVIDNPAKEQLAQSASLASLCNEVR